MDAIKDVFSIAFIAAAVAGFVGWVMNIIAIIHTLGGDITAMFIARCVGVFAAPLGAVLGYF